MQPVAAHRGSMRPIWGMLTLFLAVVMSLQFGWSEARGTWLERAVIDQATVGTAVTVIHTLTPEIGAYGAGSRIKAPGGGINILNGCEGTEVLFLLIAALLAAPLRWRVRAISALAGTVFVFVLNQVRLLVLFYSYRNDRVLFEQLHSLIAPLALIVATLAFFLLVLRLAYPSGVVRLAESQLKQGQAVSG